MQGKTRLEQDVPRSSATGRVDYSSCSNRTRIASWRSFTEKPLAGVVKMVSSPAMVPRMPYVLPNESSMRAISCAAPGLVWITTTASL